MGACEKATKYTCFRQQNEILKLSGGWKSKDEKKKQRRQWCEVPINNRILGELQRMTHEDIANGGSSQQL